LSIVVKDFRSLQEGVQVLMRRASWSSHYLPSADLLDPVTETLASSEPYPHEWLPRRHGANADLRNNTIDPAIHRVRNVRVVIPTLNAAKDWCQFAPALLAAVNPLQVLVLDSESNDGTQYLARKAGFKVRTIKRKGFSHGGTRQLAAEWFPNAEILIYLTQDAVLASPEALSNLVRALDDPEVGAVYGRQLPRPEANEIEAHLRDFNYPGESQVRSVEDRTQIGIRAAFFSNSFAAYRRSALMKSGGFPSQIILGEDTYVAGRMLLMGYKIAYAADACAYHSHDYSVLQEFKRYFDIGVMHQRERWMLDEFGSASEEGKRFVLEQMRYLWERRPSLIPSALTRIGAKLIAYRLGRMEESLPVTLKRHLSMHSHYWA
jgi:rhamnosyltransferase